MAISKEKQKQMNILLTKINKRFGPDALTTVEAVKERLKIKRILTPSIEFNDMLHGGIAKNRIIEFFGPQSSGKTSMAIQIIAKMQQDDPDVVCGWLETESSVSIDDLKRHGVDTDRLLYWDQRDYANAESALEVYRSIIASGVVSLVVINSIAGLVPKAEVEEDLEKQGMALMARLLSKFFRVTTGLATKNGVTQIFINQIRSTMDQYRPESTTGGLALAFWASQRVRFSKKKVQASDPISTEEGVKIGCITHKNRCADGKNPFLSCEYYAKYDSGIDSEVNLPQFLLNAGIVRQAGSWWYYEDGNGTPRTVNGQLCKFGSKAIFLEALKTNSVLHDELYAKLNGKTATQLTDEEIEVIEAKNKVAEETIKSIVSPEDLIQETEELFS